jgi:hypothetical protein
LPSDTMTLRLASESIRNDADCSVHVPTAVPKYTSHRRVEYGPQPTDPMRHTALLIAFPGHPIITTIDVPYHVRWPTAIFNDGVQLIERNKLRWSLHTLANGPIHHSLAQSRLRTARNCTRILANGHTQLVGFDKNVVNHESEAICDQHPPSGRVGLSGPGRADDSLRFSV